MEIEIASGLFLGDRTFQQDSVQTLSNEADEVAVMCLSDGLGGPGHGHLASRLIVRHAMAYLKAKPEGGTGEEDPGAILNGAAMAANNALQQAIKAHPEKAGMGGTLLIAMIRQGRLHYLSIGDSLVFRLRKGHLKRLNQLHTLAASASHLVASGRMADQSNNAAANSTLTSALTGVEINQVDLPSNGSSCLPGDVVLLASDGIESLAKDDLIRTLAKASESGAASAVAALVSEIASRDMEGQDNVSAVVAVVHSGQGKFCFPWRLRKDSAAKRQSVRHRW